MLTYELKKAPGVPLYEALYRCIRADILSGKLSAGEKLPSKRSLAAHLEVSLITVETAYSQLAAEGYILPKEKVGYFVERVQTVMPAAPKEGAAVQTAPPALLDLTANSPAKFPFSVWSRLQRQVLTDFGSQLLDAVPHQGCVQLRQAIAQHLSGFRGMQVDPDNIIIGAGTDFLYNLLLQLLGTHRMYALEEPGYSKIRRIYEAAGARTLAVTMDSQGICLEGLQEAQVLHISPSHHFPTGIITRPRRRQELLRWAASAEDRWIIEDDYDSEFRFDAHPMAAMYSPERDGRVIYMNSFSKTLTPSIRIGYMVLPPALMAQFHQQLGFYSCTVSAFEQHILARFLSHGHFEQHINRMRKFYRARRNKLLDILKACPWADRLTIEEADAGLHFLVQVNTALTDAQLEDFCRNLGLQINCLSRYYHGSVPPEGRSRLVVNYSGLNDRDLEKLAKLLA